MLKWQFGADTSPFRRGLNDMKAQTKALAGSLKGMIAGALGFAAIKAGFQAVFKEMDRVHKLGLRFNESAETIQRLDVAAKIAGAGIEQVAKAMQTATRNAREAADGVATYVDVFEELGIAPQDFINLPMEEKLRVIAGALGNVEGSGDRVSLALEVMGRQGAELVPLLGDIENALGEDIPVASQRTVDRIAAANDAMTRFGNQIKVFMAESVGFLADFGETASKVFKEYIESLGFVSSELAKTFGSLLKGRLSEAAEGIGNIRDEIKNLFKELTTGGQISGADLTISKEDRESIRKKAKEQFGRDTASGGTDLDAELKKAEDLKKLKDKLAESQEERRFSKLDTTAKIADLEKQDLALADDIFAGGEEAKAKAELRSLEIAKELDTLKKQLAAEEEAAEKERLERLEEIAKKEQEIAEARAEQAKEIREQGLDIVAEKQREIDSIDAGPKLKTSDLASVGGGGLAALTDTTALVERQTNIQSEILEILRTLPKESETTVEPTS